MPSKKKNNLIFKDNNSEIKNFNKVHSNDSDPLGYELDGIVDVDSNFSPSNSFEFDKRLHDEAKYIYDALNNGDINLNPDEEDKLRNDLNIILSMKSKQNNDYNISSNNLISNNFKDSTFNSYEIKTIGSDNDYENLNNNSNKKVVNSNSTNNFQDNVENFTRDGFNKNQIDDFKCTISNSEDDFQNISEVNALTTESNVGSVDIVDDSESNDEEFLSVDDALSDLVDDYSTDIVIKVNNVSMDYKLSKDKIDTLKEFFIRTVKRNREKTKTITALKNISFEISKGDRVGIIGFNGAGKSTLLKLLSRVYDPTEGTIETKGRIAPLLELGAGFDPNYTGKANIFLNGAFLGYSEDFIKEKYDEIVEFSELGDAINYHVKTYSSGMRAKLGFSIATIVEPDILIIDEILSVGDIKFQRKSSDKIRSLINSGITVLLVSHYVGQIRELCNKAIWIDDGEIKMMGEVNKVCDAYVDAANNATQEQLKNINLD